MSNLSIFNFKTMKNKYFYYPFLLLFIIFALDKIVLISDFRVLGGDEKTPLENLQKLLNNVWQNHKSNSKESVLVFFGSSRSEVFQYISKDAIKSSIFIDSEIKNKLLNYSIETRGVAKASELLYSYTSLKSLVDSGYRPEKVFIEVSPEMFNLNNPFHASYHHKMNRLSPEYLWDFLFVSESTWKFQVFKDLLFLSSYYKFKPELLLTRKVNSYSDDDFAIQLFLNLNPRIESASLINDFDVSSDSAYQEKIVGYSNELLNNSFARNYKRSSSEIYFFKKMISLIKQNNLNAIFWTPKVHPYYQSFIEPLSDTVMNEIKDNLRVNNIKYIDLRNTNFKCNRYTDSSHMSGKCAPEILSYILLNVSQMEN